MAKTNFFIGLFLCLGFMFVISSCKKDEEECCAFLECSPNVIICPDEYANTPEFSNISNLRIEGNDLRFRVADSGCDGSRWVAILIDKGSLTNTNPPQRTLRIYFENNEACDGWVERDFIFNIECLQLLSLNQVILNIAGQSILYEY